jgi:hypothetical protein
MDFSRLAFPFEVWEPSSPAPPFWDVCLESAGSLILGAVDIMIHIRFLRNPMETSRQVWTERQEEVKTEPALGPVCWSYHFSSLCWAGSPWRYAD